MKSIRIEDIFDLTEVRPPYFALENLILNEDNSLSARVPIQQPLDMEIGLISAAEAGRHLAILGACSVALLNPKKEKHFYLVDNAQLFNNFKFSDNSEVINYVHAIAQGYLINKRTARAKSSLVNRGGETIISLNIIYHVILEKSFERIYKDFKKSTKLDEGVNPYSNTLPFKVVYVSDKRLSATLGIISPSSCSGHFPEYPCVPVAIISNCLIRAAGYLLKHILKQDEVKYIVRESIVNADHLAFAGEVVNLEVEYLNLKDNKYIFRCQAIANSTKEIGTLLIHLSSIETSEIFDGTHS